MHLSMIFWKDELTKHAERNCSSFYYFLQGLLQSFHALCVPYMLIWNISSIIKWYYAYTTIPFSDMFTAAYQCSLKTTTNVNALLFILVLHWKVKTTTHFLLLLEQIISDLFSVLVKLIWGWPSHFLFLESFRNGNPSVCMAAYAHPSNHSARVAGVTLMMPHCYLFNVWYYFVYDAIDKQPRQMPTGP